MNFIKKGPARIFAAFAITLLLLAFLSGPCFAKEPDGEKRVFDQAGLFGQDQAEELEQKIGTFREKTGMDLLIVTTKDAQGKTAQSYADDFYDEGGYGVGPQQDGGLLLIDMDNRELWVSTTGRLMDYLSEEQIDRLLDRAYVGMAQEEYAQAAGLFVEGASQYYQAAQKSAESVQLKERRLKDKAFLVETLIFLTLLVFCTAMLILTYARGGFVRPARRRTWNPPPDYGYDYPPPRRGWFSGPRYDSRQPRCSRPSRPAPPPPRSESPRKSVSKPAGTGSGPSARRGAGRSFGGSASHTSSSGKPHGGGGRKF